MIDALLQRPCSTVTRSVSLQSAKHGGLLVSALYIYIYIVLTRRPRLAICCWFCIASAVLTTALPLVNQSGRQPVKQCLGCWVCIALQPISSPMRLAVQMLKGLSFPPGRMFILTFYA